MSRATEVIQPQSAARQALKSSIEQEMCVAMPGVIVSYDDASQTATIQPAIREGHAGTHYQLPLLTDVPVQMPGGAGIAMHFAVNPGDECLVVFSDTCMDSWFQRGGVQLPMIPRRHSLSDGFALVGFRSQPNALPPLGDNLFELQVKTDSGWATPLAVDKSGNLTSSSFLDAINKRLTEIGVL